MSDWILQNLLGLIALLTGITSGVLAWTKKSGVQETEYTAMKTDISVIKEELKDLSTEIVKLSNSTPAHIQAQLEKLSDSIEGMRRDNAEWQREFMLKVIEMMRKA